MQRNVVKLMYMRALCRRMHMLSVIDHFETVEKTLVNNKNNSSYYYILMPPGNKRRFS